MAAVLLAAGEPGQRKSLPSARVMLHQPSLGVSRATSTDVLIQAREGEWTRERLIEVIARHTPMTKSEVAANMDR